MGKNLSAAAVMGKRIEKGLCYGVLVLMALLPAADALVKYFHIGIPSSQALLVRLFLVAGLLAAMITTSVKEHISIAIVQYAKNEKLKNVLTFITSLISAFIVTILFWDSLSFIKYSPPGGALGFIPDRFFSLAMPIAYLIMAVRFAEILWTGRGTGRKLLAVLPVLIIILGTVAALPAIAKLLWGFEPPEFFIAPLNFLYDAAHFARTPLILLLVGAGLLGTPIFVVIGGIALLMLQASGSEPEAVPIQIYSALTDADIIAIPLFTLTGFFLSESKAGERLVAAFRSLFSWIPGGMIIA
ncbi:MAG: TRAP transporter small permease subunit, partial [Treponema sp.]|nr:TRAP transporter small permease subunit [Treponema sp.]